MSKCAKLLFDDGDALRLTNFFKKLSGNLKYSLRKLTNEKSIDILFLLTLN